MNTATTAITGRCSPSFDASGTSRDRTSSSSATGERKTLQGLQRWSRKSFAPIPTSSTSSPRGAPDFKRGTTKIPLVALTGDPVAAGLVQNLARPGGNLTGVSVDTGPTIYVKRIALLREIFPAMSKLCCIALRPQWENVMGPPLRTACDAAGIGLVSSLIDPPSSEAVYRDAIAQASRGGANAIMVADNPDTLQNRALIVRLIGAAGIPAMYSLPEFVDEGGLIAYSFDLVELNKRVANDIDAILRGANPGEIPYYQASKFELFVSLKTAKALGLTVPETLLASADKVIE